MIPMSRNVLIIGGGSAGTGAAYRAAYCGAAVTLVESGCILGGTSTLGGVNCWEPGIASAGLNRALYRRMSETPLCVGVGRTVRPYEPESHIGLNGIEDGLGYEASLRRGDLGDLQTARVHFEPLALAKAMREELQQAGVKLVMNTAFGSVCADGERITGARVTDLVTGERYLIPCDVLIDCTADAVVCRSCGVKTYFGEDAAGDFREPGAPERRSGIVNGVSLCFRVAKGDRGCEAPAWVCETEAADWIARGGLPCSNVNAYPNGDYNFNPLPLMQGGEYFEIPAPDRLRTLTARVYLYWEWMKREHGHRGFHLTGIFPRVGVRESWRCDTLCVTTENDLRKGASAQGDDVIALADHVLDTHGQRSGQPKLPSALKEPYGIRAGSLIVKDYANLLVAGRCAGFSHLAASSCRLSRTMMDLGEAAGAMAALSGDVREICPAQVRERLRFNEYLEWVERSYYRIGNGSAD